VVAARDRVPDVGLVRVELVDSLRGERLAHASVDRLRQRRKRGGACRLP
jgi:hypothetical protein